MYTQDTFLTNIWQTISDYFANGSYSQTVQRNRYLVWDPYFLMLAREKYRSIRETELEDLIRDGGKLDKQFETLEELRQSIGSCVTSDQVQLRVETEKQDKTEVLVMTDLTEAAVSLQVNGLWFYTQPLDSVKAVFEIPDSVLRGKGKYNCIQARLVGGYGAYLVNPYGTVEGDYTNAISNYTYLSR